MLEDNEGKITLTSSAEFNAILWAARAEGDDKLAERLLSLATWENTDVGTRTRRAELDPVLSAYALFLIGDVASGEVVVRPEYKKEAEAMADYLRIGPPNWV